MMAPRESTFEPLDLRKRSLAQVDPNQYRVFSLAGEVHQIQANTAYEALRQSGLGEAIKIERIFITARHVIARGEFSDNDEFQAGGEFDDMFGGTAVDENDPLAHFRRRKNPIISPAELDALMRALHAMGSAGASSAEPAGEAVASDNAAPLSQRHLTDDHNERVCVPAPAPEAPLPQEAKPLAGLDVHGDGFDEIIPAAVNPAPAVKPAMGDALPNAAAASEVPPVPERELSSEEIDALLNQK